MNNSSNRIPSVHELKEQLSKEFPDINENFLTHMVRTSLDNVRQMFRAGKSRTSEEILKITRNSLHKTLGLSLSSIINGSGVVLHTNLGRAPLSRRLLSRLSEISDYVSLEMNMDTGERGERNDHNEFLLNYLSGAEASLTVNNNAAAVLLALSALTAGGEVIVSRSQLVEIGGSFRIPDVMKQSGAVMVEVGSTNRCHLKDFQLALSPRTKAVFIAHSSNFSITGFTAFPSLHILVEFAHKHSLPVIYDLGSGILEGMKIPLKGEAVIRDIFNSGVDVLTYSGDKLLGGPQAGIASGRKEYISRMIRHPLYRALRCDKLILTALQLTLQEYLLKQPNIPAHRYLERETDELRRLLSLLTALLPENIRPLLQAKETTSESGSGTAPGEQQASLSITFDTSEKAASIAERFRSPEIIPVLGYIHRDTFHIDLRAVSEDLIPLLAEKISFVMSPSIATEKTT